VIDTCSILQIRRDFERKVQDHILSGLSAKVDAGLLVYPKQVPAELERFKNPKKPDRPYEWAKRNEEMATRFGDQFEELREVLAHPQVRRVFDPDKAVGIEEADPYVLALASALKKQGYTVTVLTEESRNRPDKLSVSSACGLLRLFCLPIQPFLEEQGLLPPGRT